jgi:hypothetical protein
MDRPTDPVILKFPDLTPAPSPADHFFAKLPPAAFRNMGRIMSERARRSEEARGGAETGPPVHERVGVIRLTGDETPWELVEKVAGMLGVGVGELMDEGSGGEVE